MSNNVHPEILDGLEFESQFIQNTSGSQRRDVKLKRGDAWLLRFLPVKLGPSKRWYARIAKHWLNKKMVFCPRNTEEAYGGSPDAYCPVCELSAHLNDDSVEAVRDFGYDLRGGAQWTTWCVVFEKSVNGGNAQVMPTPEVLQPYTFNHYRSTWEELTTFLRQGTKRAANSVLDLELGNDFYATKGAKGVRLDKQDSSPIFKIDDPAWDANIEKIFAACKAPIVKMPEAKALETFADKAQEEADNLVKAPRRSSSNGQQQHQPRRGSAEGDDLPPDEDQPDAQRPRGRQEEDNVRMDHPPRRAAAPQEPVDTAPRRRSAPPQEEQQAEPAPRRAAVEPAPARRAAAPAQAAPARRAAAPPPEPEAEPEQDGAAEEGSEEGSIEIPNDVEPTQPAPRNTSRPSSRGPATSAPPAAPARRATAAPARGGAPAQESLDEDENVAEEANDHAPAEPLSDATDEGAAEEPPQVDRRGANLGSNIKSRIAAVSASAKK